MSKTKFSSVVLLCDSCHGVYLPMRWAWNIDVEMFGITPEDEDVLKTGPEHDLYWETWTSVLSYAKCTDKEGNEFSLYQDGDLWAICYERMTSEERQSLGFEE